MGVYLALTRGLDSTIVGVSSVVLMIGMLRLFFTS
jgi:hypothetical protein